jgi:hypothetical protein
LLYTILYLSLTIEKLSQLIEFIVEEPNIISDSPWRCYKHTFWVSCLLVFVPKDSADVDFLVYLKSNGNRLLLNGLRCHFSLHCNHAAPSLSLSQLRAEKRQDERRYARRRDTW